MEITTLLILVILAFVAIFGLILIGFGLVVYRQQNQIKKQKQQLKRLHKNLNIVQTTIISTVEVPAPALFTPIVRDVAPATVQQVLPVVEVKIESENIQKSGTETVERKEKVLPDPKPPVTVFEEIAPPVIRQVISEIRISPENVQKSGAETAERKEKELPTSKPSTPIVRDIVPISVSQVTPAVKIKPESIQKSDAEIAEHKEKELPAAKLSTPIIRDIALISVSQVTPAVKIKPESIQKADAKISDEKLVKGDYELSADEWFAPLVKIPFEQKAVNEKQTTGISEKGEIEITEQFQQALEIFNSNSPCVFITGKAGTGKSELLNHFLKHTQKSVVVLAPTGMAALKINGQTIHSFFGFPSKILSEEDIKPSQKRELYRAVDTIVVDEISMVRADMLDAIDQFLQLNGKDPQKPFGGAQMVFFGDLYQLPPVVADEDESKYLASNYKGSFFFDAHVMKKISMEKLELTKVFRQKELEFINALNAVRTNTADKKNLDYINQRVASTRSKDRNAFITLVTTNKSADSINHEELGKIPLQPFAYTAALEGEFTRDQSKKRMPADLELTLKKGAQVIFIKNDAGKRWLNGSKGKIIELGENYIRAEVEQEDGNFEYEIARETWEMIKYKFDFSTFKIKSEVVGKFTQYPLRLGWAITIHKSQGSTLERVHIDMGSGSFAAGQSYVALSRCRSLQGMTLERPFTFSDIKSDASVVRYMAEAFPVNVQTATPPAVERAVKNRAEKKSKGARFVSDKIDEEHKYTESGRGTPKWFVDKSTDMIVPLVNNLKHGVDIKKYRGECNVYVNGKYRWRSIVHDELSVQSFWNSVQAHDNVSVEPLEDFVIIQLN